MSTSTLFSHFAGLTLHFACIITKPPTPFGSISSIFSGYLLIFYNYKITVITTWVVYFYVIFVMRDSVCWDGCLYLEPVCICVYLSTLAYPPEALDGTLFADVTLGLVLGRLCSRHTVEDRQPNHRLGLQAHPLQEVRHLDGRFPWGL